MNSLLLIEDEPAISEPLMARLRSEHFEVCLATTCAEAQRAVQRRPDLILLDWVLPDGEGLDLVRTWRRAGLDIPIIFLTARVELLDKVLGLEMGADDYVTKPFEPRELLARIRARLRSTSSAAWLSSIQTAVTLTVGPLQLCPDTRQVHLEGEPIQLARLEFDLLHLLMAAPDRVFTRDELLDRVWGYNAFPSTRTVDTHIHELRRKLRPDLFKSVRGVGYRLVSQAH